MAELLKIRTEEDDVIDQIRDEWQQDWETSQRFESEEDSSSPEESNESD